MFFEYQAKNLKQEYIDALSTIGSLSNLFSNSTTPYLYYRVAEKIFCQSFGANDLSRGDIALDASKEHLGIGLKTFLKKNNNTLQKIAEFNKDRELYKDKTPVDMMSIVSNLRNSRVSFAEKLTDVESSIYHCIIREENKFHIFEESMSYIDIENISDIKKKKNSIWFNDGINEYNFNISKSTLLKRFDTNLSIEEFEVSILDDPLDNLNRCLTKNKDIWDRKDAIQDTLYLPLYGKNRVVSPKSGLNQWHASGRQRDYNEVYIPIPSKIHKCSKEFFPNRDMPFTLHLPNGSSMSAKVCQDNSKALMSNPNKELGKWILRDILNLKEGELLSYEKLQFIGIDSIRIDKIDKLNYKINFVELGSFENYIDKCESEYL